MPTFEHALNTDANLRLTTSVWDTDVAQWMMKTQNYVQTAAGVWVPLALDDNGYLKASIKDSALPTGAATQTTLASVLAKMLTAPSTEAKQDALIAKDFATQTTLAQILAKILTAPSTEAKQDAIIAILDTISGHVDGLEGYTDGLETLATALNGYVDGLEGKDLATQTTLAEVLAKISADPATQTTLAQILAKLIVAPATEAKQDTLIAKDFATQTTLAEMLAKMLTAPSTEAKQDTLITAIAAIVAGSDSASVKVSSNKTEDITFHDAVIAVADGMIFNVEGYKTLLVEVTGTATESLIQFLGRGANGANRIISGVNLNGYSVATSTSGVDELWQFDITGLHSIFMSLQNIGNGNITVKGRAVA